MLHRMPAKNPRISVTVTPETSAILARMAALQGGSVSSVVGELLEFVLPIFERIGDALEAAEQIKHQATESRVEIVEGLERAQQRIEAQLGLALDDLDHGYKPLLQLAEGVNRRKAKAEPERSTVSGSAARAPARPSRKGASTPVAVTRGSGTPKTSGIRTKGSGRGRV